MQDRLYNHEDAHVPDPTMPKFLVAKLLPATYSDPCAGLQKRRTIGLIDRTADLQALLEYCPKSEDQYHTWGVPRSSIVKRLLADHNSLSSLLRLEFAARKVNWVYIITIVNISL